MQSTRRERGTIPAEKRFAFRESLYKMMSVRRSVLSKMMSGPKGAAGFVAGLLILAVLGGCTSWLGSTTMRITYYLESSLYHLENEIESAEVDLQDNEDWQDHRDDVTGINRILFAFWVINPTTSDATAQFYISTDEDLATAQQIQDHATLVLDGISVPAQDSVYINARDSYQYFRNVDELTDRLIEGQFHLYCISSSAPFEIEVPDSAAFMIEFTFAVDWEF